MVTFTCVCPDPDRGLHHNHANAWFAQAFDTICGRGNDELRGGPVAGYRLRVAEASQFNVAASKFDDLATHEDPPRRIDFERQGAGPTGRLALP